MTIEKFIDKYYTIPFKNLGYVPNKILSKVLKLYKNIDIRQYRFDTLNNSDKFTLEGIEKIIYDWTCPSIKEMRKELRRYILKIHKSKYTWSSEYAGSKYYLFYFKDLIIEIILSNKGVKFLE